LLPISPLELQIDPCPLKVAGAVTASAAFPPLVGPITFTVGEDLEYWHTGDGGLYENLGLESLMFIFLKQLQDHTVRRALILSFNSSYPFSVGFRVLGRRSEPWTIFNYDFSVSRASWKNGRRPIGPCSTAAFNSRGYFPTTQSSGSSS